MKLAFCLFKYFPYGGLQRDFLRIARLCLARGHEVHVYTTKWQDLTYGLQLHMIQPRGLQNHTRYHSYVKKTLAALKKENYDAVIGFNKMPGLDFYYAADVCFAARAREKHGFLYSILPRYRQYAAHEKAVFNKDAKTDILLIAKAQQAIFKQYYATEDHRFHLLPPGIAKDRKAPSNAQAIRSRVRAKHFLQPNDYVLLMVGSGFKTKGVDRSILSLAALPEAIKKRTQLWIIGEDNPQSFQALAQKSAVGDKVHFLGGRSDVPDYLLAADLLLHPAYHENTGTVLLEAIVAGLPVLTVEACGYAPYITQAQAGYVLPAPFDQTTWNQQLETMLLSDQRAIWQKNGMTFAQTADIYSLPERTVEHIEAFQKHTVSEEI